MFGDNKFVNDYTEKSLMAEIKSALKKKKETKNAKDIFEGTNKRIKKDYLSIRNKVEIPATGDIDKKRK